MICIADFVCIECGATQICTRSQHDRGEHWCGMCREQTPAPALFRSK